MGINLTMISGNYELVGIIKAQTMEQLLRVGGG